MDARLNQQFLLLAVGMSAAALFFSLLAAFPGLKNVLAAVRDGLLWFAMFMIAGAGGYLAWQTAQVSAPATASAHAGRGSLTADAPPLTRP